MAETCDDCKIVRTYRPQRLNVEPCSLHRAAPDLLRALNNSAKLAHKNTKSHSYWLSFKECNHETCKAAHEAVRKAESNG